ncbi:MAG TPA: IclR family transcriptional regulator C-terminal domain-containing protein, partial [Gammaproteobacteria bacterium]|nr:IclR family transcriptional regulator C-terminal domain-containing protein [Gammaproteobacteria bacterium]
HTLVDAQQLWRDASEALDRGYALDNEEAELGVGCIATPVLNADGKMAAGLSVSAPIERRDRAWSAPVVAAGQKLSARLGYYSKSH